MDETEAALELHQHIAQHVGQEPEVVEVVDEVDTVDVANAVADEPAKVASVDEDAPVPGDAEAALTSIIKSGADALADVSEDLRGDREFMLAASRLCPLL